MRTYNKVMLRGFISEKPNVKVTPTQKKVANISLITYRRKMDKGETVSQPDFHKLILWQGLAETAETYLDKGDVIFIEGQIQNNQYKDKDGKMKYTNEITVERLDIIASKKGTKLEINESQTENSTNKKED